MARELRQARLLDQNKIARTQETTRLAVDSLPDAVFLVGPEGKVEIANRSAAKIDDRTYVIAVKHAAQTVADKIGGNRIVAATG